MRSRLSWDIVTLFYSFKKYSKNFMLKWTVKEKWKGVKNETWESQELNYTYKTSIMFLSREIDIKLCQIYTKMHIYVMNLSNHSLGCLERWKYPCMIIEGLQYGFGELYWRTKPRGVRNDFFSFFLKTSNNPKKV